MTFDPMQFVLLSGIIYNFANTGPTTHLCQIINTMVLVPNWAMNCIINYMIGTGKSQTDCTADLGQGIPEYFFHLRFSTFQYIY